MTKKIVREKLNETEQWVLTIEDLGELLSRTQLEDSQYMAKKVYIQFMREIYAKKGNRGVVREFNKTIKDIEIKAIAPGKYIIVYDFLDEYAEGERQEGQRFREPGQVDYPLAEENDEVTVDPLTGDKAIEDDEVEEQINSGSMEAGIFIKPHHDYLKKQL